MSVLKEVELTASSEQSFEDAVRQGMEEAARTAKGIGTVEVVRWMVDLDNDKVSRYRVTLHVSCADAGELGQKPAQPAQTHQPTAAMSPGDEVPPDTPGAGEDVCPVCGGSGTLSGRACTNCSGTGTVMRAVGGA